MLQMKRAKAKNKIERKTLAIYAAVSVLSLFVTRTSLFSAVWPYGMALMIGCLLADVDVTPVAVGVLAGYLSLLPDSLADMTLGLIACVGFVFIKSARKNIKTIHGILMLGILLLGLPFRASTPYGFITGALEIFAGAMMVMVFAQMARMAAGKEKGLPTEEKMTLCILGLCLATAGAATLDFSFFSLGLFTALVITACFGYAGSAASGVAVGVTSGLALAVGGEPLQMVGILGLLGGLYGVFRVFKRPLMTISVLFANLTVYLVYPVASLPFPELLVASALILALPERVWNYFRQFSDGAIHKQRVTEHYIRQVRSYMDQQLLGCARAFTDISEAITPQNGFNQKEMDDFAETVAGTICVDCPNKPQCWSADFVHTYAAFEAMSAICHGEEAEEPAWLYERCEKKDEIFKAMKDLSGEDTETLRLKRALWESRSLAGKQMLEAGKVMMGIVDNKTPYVYDARMEQLIMEEFGTLGIRVYDVDARTTVPVTVRLTLKNGLQSQVEEAVSRACGRPMSITSRRQGKKLERFELEETVKIDLFTATLQQSAKEGEPCGDSWDTFLLDNSRRVFLLSDGMGVGEKANKESQTTVTLLADMLTAGFDTSFVLDTVNRLLLLKGEETYATLDLLLVDTAGKKAQFIKVSAPPSYILYGGSVDKICGSSLPIGILESAPPSVEERVLSGMEYIFMMSDGITDCAGEQIETWIKELKSNDCRSMAKELLNRARENGLKDDATVTVIATENRGSVFKTNMELLAE